MHPDMRQLFLLITAGSALFAAGMLVYRRLWSTYPALLCYLLVETLQGCVLFAQDGRSRQYFYLWAPFQLLSTITSLAIVTELTGQLVRRYKGIAFAARGFYLGSTLLSIAIAGWIGWIGYQSQAPVELSTGTYAGNYLAFYSRLGLSVTILSTAAFLGLLGFLLMYFPFEMPGNAYRHYVISLVYMFGGAAGYLLARTSAVKANIQWVNSFLMLLSAGCFLAWALKLRRQEQDSTTQTSHHEATRERELQFQLEHINQLLLRTLENR